MLEIERLADMLEAADIPFGRRNEDLKSAIMNFFHCKINYPDTYETTDIVCSIIQGTYTYGGLENKLEIKGLLTEEEKENDDVCGWLTAEDVFERIKAHWETVKD